MSIINTLPLTLTNGTTADATQVMSLFAWIQSQTNGNACPATVGSSILKGDGAGGTTAAVVGTDYPAIASPTFTGTVTAPTFAGNLTGNVTGNASGTSANVTGTVAIANGGTGQTTAVLGGSALGAVAVNQVWADVTASRVLGTTYTNNTGRPLGVNIIASYNNASAAVLFLNGAEFVALTTANGQLSVGTLSTIVPVGATYRVTSAQGVSFWYELQ